MNVAVLEGRVVDDPVRKETSKGVVASFRLAVDCQPRVWIDVEVWGQLAGRVHLHAFAGRVVVVSGALRCSEWLTAAGEKRSRWFVAADRVTFIAAPDVAAEPARD